VFFTHVLKFIKNRIVYLFDDIYAAQQKLNVSSEMIMEAHGF